MIMSIERVYKWVDQTIPYPVSISTSTSTIVDFMLRVDIVLSNNHLHVPAICAN